MPRPTQRKPGAPFYFRVRVPADVRGSVGKSELSYSLGTSDETEAKRRFAVEMAKHTSHWEALRKGPQPILMHYAKKYDRRKALSRTNAEQKAPTFPKNFQLVEK